MFSLHGRGDHFQIGNSKKLASSMHTSTHTWFGHVLAGTKDSYFAYYNINITLGSTNEKYESLSLGIIM